MKNMSFLAYLFVGIDFILVINVSSMNSEQRKLCVNCSLNIDARLLWKAAIYSNCTQEVDNKIIKTSMP